MGICVPRDPLLRNLYSYINCYNYTDAISQRLQYIMYRLWPTRGTGSMWTNGTTLRGTATILELPAALTLTERWSLPVLLKWVDSSRSATGTRYSFRAYALTYTLPKKYSFKFRKYRICISCSKHACLCTEQHTNTKHLMLLSACLRRHCSQPTITSTQMDTSKFVIV